MPRESRQRARPGCASTPPAEVRFELPSTAGSRRNPLPADTEWVRHLKIRSEVLSAFWGRPMFLRAAVVLPKGWNTDAGRQYPRWSPSRLRHPVYRGGSFHGGRACLRSAWLAADAPRLLRLQLDGRARWGSVPGRFRQSWTGTDGPSSGNDPPGGIRIPLWWHREPACADGRFDRGWKRWRCRCYPDFFGVLEWVSGPAGLPGAAVGEHLFGHQCLCECVGIRASLRPSGQWRHGSSPCGTRRSWRMCWVLGIPSYSPAARGFVECHVQSAPARGAPAAIGMRGSGRVDPAVAKAWEHFDLRRHLDNWAPLVGPDLRGEDPGSGWAPIPTSWMELPGCSRSS